MRLPLHTHTHTHTSRNGVELVSALVSQLRELRGVEFKFTMSNLDLVIITNRKARIMRMMKKTEQIVIIEVST